MRHSDVSDIDPVYVHGTYTQQKKVPDQICRMQENKHPVERTLVHSQTCIKVRCSPDKSRIKVSLCTKIWAFGCPTKRYTQLFVNRKANKPHLV